MVYNINKDIALRDWQIEALDIFQTARFFILTVARQHGKSWLGRQVLLDFLMKYPRPTGREREIPTAIVLTTSVAQSMALYYDKLHEHYLKDLPKSVCWKTGNAAGNHVTLNFRRPNGDIAQILFLGMNSNTRGLTCDFLLADEVAQFNAELLSTVYFPMLDDTGGKAYLTSTIHGDDHYWQMVQGYRELSRTNSKYGEYEKNIITAGLRTDLEIEEKITEAKATGTYHLYLQEYMNYPYAAARGESPFAEKIWRARETKRVITLNRDLIGQMRHININIDIGKGGNNRMWAWGLSVTGDLFMWDHWDDLETILDLPRYLKEKYRTVPYINVFLPNDINQPSLELGGTRYDNLAAQIRRLGLQHQIRLFIMNKTKSTDSLLMGAIELVDKCYFDKEGTSKGLSRLSGSRFRKDTKTKEVIFGKWVNNGHQHSGDAFSYISAVIDNNLIPSSPYLRDSPLKSGKLSRVGRKGLTY